MQIPLRSHQTLCNNTIYHFRVHFQIHVCTSIPLNVYSICNHLVGKIRNLFENTNDPWAKNRIGWKFGFLRMSMYDETNRLFGMGSVLVLNSKYVRVD